MTTVQKTISPVDGRVLVQRPLASDQAIDAVLDAACSAQVAWRATPLGERVEALNAMVRGDRRIALNHLRDVVKQDTNHIDAYLQMGDILREEGNAQAAVKIHQSLTVRPNLSNDINRDIHKSLALDFEQLGQFAKARREAEFVLKQNKKMGITQFNLLLLIQIKIIKYFA